MNRKQTLWLGGVLTLLLAIVIIVVSVNVSNEPTEEAESFCDAFSNALFCREDNPSEQEIAADMLITLMAHYPNVMSEQFCTNYFMGNLQDYCLTDPTTIVPIDFSIVSSDFEIVRIQDGLYDVRTHYSNNVPAYTIRLALNNADGAYHFSGFSYYDTPASLDLGLSEEDIDSFMTTMITAGEDPSDTFCTTYFTWIARSVCELDQDAYITDSDVVHNYTVNRVATNRYEYTVSSEDDSISLQYTILFEDLDGTIKISELDISIPDDDLEE